MSPLLSLARPVRLLLRRLPLLERRPVRGHVLPEPVPAALVHYVKDHLVAQPAQLAPGPPRAQHHRLHRLTEPRGKPRVARRFRVPQQPTHAVRDSPDEEPVRSQRVAAPRRAPAEGSTRQVRHRGPDDQPPVVHDPPRAVPLVIVHHRSVALGFAVDVKARLFSAFQAHGLVEPHLDEFVEGRAVVALVHAPPRVLFVHLTGGAAHAAVAVGGGPYRARSEVAADPYGRHLDVRQRELVGWGEVEEDAAEAVVLAILGVLREGLVVDELGEFALEDERRVWVGRRGQSGRGTAVDGTKRPATGDSSRTYRVSTTTRKSNCHRDGEGSRRGGSRTRTSALTGGGATSTGWTTSVMALGRVAETSEARAEPTRGSGTTTYAVFFVPKPGRGGVGRLADWRGV